MEKTHDPLSASRFSWIKFRGEESLTVDLLDYDNLLPKGYGRPSSSQELKPRPTVNYKVLLRLDPARNQAGPSGWSSGPDSGASN